MAELTKASFTQMPGKSPPASQSSLPIPATLFAVRRWWWLMTLLGGFAATGPARYMDHSLPRGSTVRTLVYVMAQRAVLLHEGLAPREDPGGYQREELGLVRSRLVLRAALRQLQDQGEHLQLLERTADPVAWLEQAVQGDYSIPPEVLRITIKGGHPDELLLLVNAVRDAYLQEVVNKTCGFG